jgi:hypothetical protein
MAHLLQVFQKIVANAGNIINSTSYRAINCGFYFSGHLPNSGMVYLEGYF